MIKKQALMVLTLAALGAHAPAAFAQDQNCKTYDRTVTFADGTARQAEGTACLDSDGVWRIRQEHLAEMAAPLPPQQYYAPPAYYYPAAPAYYAYPPYYADPFYGPYYYGPSVGFGVTFHDGGHWDGHDGGHWHH